MDLRVVSDVLGVIRQKPAIMEMEKVEPYKRIFGTDMEPDNDEEWSNLMKRHKIKQRLKAARERRKAKLLSMEDKLSSENGGQVNPPETPVHDGERKRSVQSLLMEYKQMHGQVPMKNQQKKERKVSKEDIHKILSRNDAFPQIEKEKNDDTIKYVPMQEKKAEDSENLSSKVFVEAVIEHRSEPNMISNEEPSMVDNRSESPMIAQESKSKDFGNNDEENDEIVSPNREEDKNTNAEKSKTKKKKFKRPKRRQKEDTRETRRRIKEGDDMVTSHTKAEKLADNNGGKALWKKSKSKVMPFATVCTKLRQHLSEENKRQMDLLETIRILRGISKDEFYKDMNEETESESEPEAMEEHEEPEITNIEEAEEPILKKQDTEVIVTELKEEQYENPKPNVENAEMQNEVEIDDASEASQSLIFVEVKKKQAVQPQEKDEKEQTKVGSRVDSRWPKGHPYHTKPVEQKYMALYMKPVGKTLGRKKILNIHSLPRTAKEIQEYLKWREKMLEIAYLDEFDHLKKNSLRLFPMPLPEIETSSSSDSTMLHTERTFSQSTDRSACTKRYQPTSHKKIIRKSDQYKYLVYKKTTLSHTSVIKSKCKDTDSVSSIKNQTKRRNNQVYKTVTETVKTKRLHKRQDFSENDVESISKDFESQMTFEQRQSREFHTGSPDSLDISGNVGNDNRDKGLLTTNANLGNYNTAGLNREMQNSPTPTHLKNERISLPKIENRDNWMVNLVSKAEKNGERNSRSSRIYKNAYKLPLPYKAGRWSRNEYPANKQRTSLKLHSFHNYKEIYGYP